MTAKTAAPQKEKLHDFYRELEQLLCKQLEQQPDLQDVRLKLLELYYETRRPEEFLKTARPLLRALGDPARSREWQRVASMGRMLLPGEALFSGHAADTVEFVAESKAPLAEEPRKFRRFGDDDKHRALFDDLSTKYAPVRKDARFLAELELLLVGLPTRRPTPLIAARRLSQHLGGAQIFVKREDFAGDSPHLVVAVCGQALLARRLGCRTLVTGSVDGRRGAAVAAVAARLGMDAVVYMDAEQSQRSAALLLQMKLMGARVELVKSAHYRNRDVREAALEHWARDPAGSFLMMGLDAAPPPYPLMTQEFTATIGRELRRQLSVAAKGLPALIATRGGHSADALALFPAFLADRGVRLACVEAEAEPDLTPVKDADPFTQVGMALTPREKTIAAGILDRLEYPSVAREHAWLRASGRVDYVQTSRAAARGAVQDLARFEAVVPPLETAHVFAWACQAARTMEPARAVVVVMGEPSDKNLWDISRLMEEKPAR